MSDHDAKRRGLADDRLVPAQRTEIRVVLDIDLDADPITGSLCPAIGPPRRFSGWIALAAALQAIRAETARAPPEPAGDP